MYKKTILAAVVASLLAGPAHAVTAATSTTAPVTTVTTVTTPATTNNNITTVTTVTTVTTNVIDAATIAPSLAPTLPVIPDKLPAHPEWKSSASLGLTVAKGNTDTLLVNGQIASEKITKHNEFTVGLEGGYGDQNTVKNIESLHGYGQWNHLFTPRLFSYLRADGLHDGISELDYRYTLSPGVGYYFVKNTNTTFAAEAGPGVVFERLGGIDDTYATLRVGERYEHKFNPRTRFWETIEVLPEVDKWQKYIANAEVGIEAAITKTLSLKTYVQDNYVNRPALDRHNNDIKLVSGISVKF